MTTKFRASIYLDILIDGDKPLEDARREAIIQAYDVVSRMTLQEFRGDLNFINPYVGDVAHFNPKNLLKPLDREI